MRVIETAHLLCNYALFLLVGTLIGLTIGAYLANTVTYKQAQIDALTGHVKYELTTRPNGETVWTERKQP